MNDFPISIRGRFKRSIDLVQDFHSAPNIEGYIVTPTARQVLGQIRDTLAEGRSQRAWTLTGPYGSGKSAFALFASHVMRGKQDAIDHLRDADAALGNDFDDIAEHPFCPVLVGGSRQSLTASLLQGLATSVDRFLDKVSRDKSTQGYDHLRRVVDGARDGVGQAGWTDEETVDLFAQAADAVHGITGGGLLVIVDELGKMLEYASIHPEEGDIFALQLLAERASRTAEREEPPLLLATILHQAFDRYASHLDRVQREEWQKVQGRFEDVAYVEPTDATVQLLAKAIQVDDQILTEQHVETVDRVMDAANLPARLDEDETSLLLRDAFPLHPAVSLIVGPLFHRLAQNERSLFAFLAGGEPGGFLDVLRREYEGGSMPLYRLDHLYSYLLTTLGGTLFNQGASKLWAETESALGRLKDPSPLAEQLLKQIALLNYVGEMAGLTASTDLLVATSDARQSEVNAELQKLREQRVVVYRAYDDSYRIWQGSDIDLDAELQTARAHVSPDVSLAELLRETLPPSPVAAHRHSYSTGTTRVFEVLYASRQSWRQQFDQRNEAADGYIVYVLPERGDRREELIEELCEAVDDAMLFFAIPEGVGTLRNAVYELRCMDWIRQNVDALEGDAAARRELAERKADLEHRVEAKLNRLLVTDESGRNPCLWIRQDENEAPETLRFDDQKSLQAELSKACDRVYTKTPEIWNELLNLRQPSPSAVRGQKKLLEAMAIGNDEEERAPHKERLGIEGTPAEYGLYASIVRHTGMHREREDGAWHFTPPYKDKKPGCYAVWQYIASIFADSEGRPVALDSFFDRLPQPPYGVRQGLIPVFLFAHYKANEDEIAIYENGTFVKALRYGTIERLLKSPEKFAMQQVDIAGVRQDLLRKLAPLVGLPEDERKPLPFVLRLLRRVHGLPPYVRQTSKMSEEALAVRQILHRASDPTKLLFEELPSRLDIGVDSFLSATALKQDSVDIFVEKLQGALREITTAYDQLIRRIQGQIAAKFDVRGDSAEEQRREVAERARTLEPHVSDADLKAFIIRAGNEMMDAQAWYESIAALLANKPPVKWVDDDEKAFNNELRRIAKKFRNREPLIFESEDDAEEDNAEQQPRLQKIRVGVTMLGEKEQETVIQLYPEDEPLVDDAVNHLYQVFKSDKVLKDASTTVRLATLARLIQRLEQEHESSLDAKPKAEETS